MAPTFLSFIFPILDIIFVTAEQRNGFCGLLLDIRGEKTSTNRVTDRQIL